MNFYTMLQKRDEEQNPVRVGVIGAGKFSSMFLSQARLTPGMQLVAVADLFPEKALDALEKTGWDRGQAAEAGSAGEINDIARNGKIAITADSSALLDSDCQVVMEITGNPEVGTIHAVKAINAGETCGDG